MGRILEKNPLLTLWQTSIIPYHILNLILPSQVGETSSKLFLTEKGNHHRKHNGHNAEINGPWGAIPVAIRAMPQLHPMDITATPKLLHLWLREHWGREGQKESQSQNISAVKQPVLELAV